MPKAYKKYLESRGKMKKRKPKRVSAIQRFAPHTPPRPEIKSVDCSVAPTAITTAAQFYLLNGMVPGTQFYNRIGQKINMKSITIRWNIGVGVPGAAADDYVRIMVIYDKQTNGAFPALADVLQDISQNGTAQSDCLTGLNLQNRNRFVVLRDHTLSNYNALGTVQQVVSGADTETMDVVSKVEYIPLEGAETIFKSSGATGAVTEVQSGSLIVMAVGQTVANQAFNLSYRARLRYTDQ